jgi:hypothetical protein
MRPEVKFPGSGVWRGQGESKSDTCCVTILPLPGAISDVDITKDKGNPGEHEMTSWKVGEKVADKRQS